MAGWHSLRPRSAHGALCPVVAAGGPPVAWRRSTPRHELINHGEALRIGRVLCSGLDVQAREDHLADCAG
eukprot:scaffold7973_cov109-Isochrysis_galbana.AAC.3